MTLAHQQAGLGLAHQQAPVVAAPSRLVEWSCVPGDWPDDDTFAGTKTLNGLEWTVAGASADYDVAFDASAGWETEYNGGSAGGAVSLQIHVDDWLSANGETYTPGDWLIEAAIQGACSGSNWTNGGGMALNVGAGNHWLMPYFSFNAGLFRRESRSGDDPGTWTPWGNYTTTPPSAVQILNRNAPTGGTIIGVGADGEVTSGVRPTWRDLPSRVVRPFDVAVGDADADPANAACPLNAAWDPTITLQFNPRGTAAGPLWTVSHIWLRAIYLGDL